MIRAPMGLDDVARTLIEVALMVWGAERVRRHVDVWERAREEADAAERIKFGRSSRD